MTAPPYRRSIATLERKIICVSDLARIVMAKAKAAIYAQMRRWEDMRIAVASKGLDVCEHFRCCTNFNFYTVEQGKLVDSRNLPSQGRPRAAQADLLRQIEVEVLLCGEISEEDVKIMNRAGITVIPGVSGRAFAAAEDYLGSTFDESPVRTG